MEYNDQKMQEIYQNISEVIERIIPETKGKISPEKDIVKDFNPDSLSLIDIIMGAEDILGISISDSELEKLKTVGDYVKFAYDRIYNKK